MDWGEDSPVTPWGIASSSPSATSSILNRGLITGTFCKPEINPKQNQNPKKEGKTYIWNKLRREIPEKEEWRHRSRRGRRENIGGQQLVTLAYSWSASFWFSSMVCDEEEEEEEICLVLQRWRI